MFYILLARYSEDVEGVILAFQNIKLLNNMSEIVDESYYIRINVKADCLVFRPTRGMELMATVNMIRLHYLGLIVEGLFNASVPEDLMPSGSFYDSVKHTWVVKDTAMEIGSVLRVKVDR